jgi:NAD(P)H dehydrogenase (quinone)
MAADQRERAGHAVFAWALNQVLEPTVKCLVVIAHPLKDSLCNALATHAINSLRSAGHEVHIEHLYDQSFAPALTAAERQSYYSAAFDARNLAAEIDHLTEAEALLLVFPTWWFGLPAILKGWFDRVWAPGVAYDHAVDLGAIQPRLTKLRTALAITTLGSPWWVDRFVMWQPIKRQLKTALIGTCAPACKFQMLSLYQSEKVSSTVFTKFCQRITSVLGYWK